LYRHDGGRGQLFAAEKKRLDIEIDFKTSGRFAWQQPRKLGHVKCQHERRFAAQVDGDTRGRMDGSLDSLSMTMQQFFASLCPSCNRKCSAYQ
jgi:hypothetical protein